jgi:hypothetical protein
VPRGRKPEGEKPLTSAERQARYRARRPMPRPAGAVRRRKAADRRSRPQRWHDAVAEPLALQADYAAWLEALPGVVLPSMIGSRAKQNNGLRLPVIPDRVVYPGISLAALPLMWDLGCTRCCKVNRRCRKSPPKTTRPGWRLIAARSRSAALASSDDAGPPYFPAHKIPDIAAKSGIIRLAIPMLNGSKCANEHFSGCFRQSDNRRGHQVCRSP